MTLRQGAETLAYDAEDRLVQWTDGTDTATFLYDADGKRVAKTEDDVTRHYVSQWYEVDVTASEVTVSYWHGGKLVAVKKGTTLEYVHQEHLGSSSVVTNTSGALVSSMTYLPYGEIRSSAGTLPTERQFTGQRRDGLSGLYFYNARYYDAGLGRFISPDIFVLDEANPQDLNRYSYVRNNPAKYTDPSGHFLDTFLDVGGALVPFIPSVGGAALRTARVAEAPIVLNWRR
jgi:RHS repeat-associated protein